MVFGDAQNCTGTDRATLHFTGKEGDTESNLTHFWFRQLSTTQGRWIMPDPAGMAAVNPADPQSWNRYTYVGNNPASATDPLGLWDDGGGDPPECRPGDPFCDPCVFTVDCSDPPIPPGGPVPLPPPRQGPSVGRVSRIGGKWPNNETLGLPAGLNLKPMGLAELIGLSPGTSCDWVCVTIGSGFASSVTGGGTVNSPFTLNVLVLAAFLPATNGDPTLDNRANALAAALNRTGVQAIANPCTYIAWTAAAGTLGAVGLGLANSSEIAAVAKESAPTLTSGLLKWWFNLTSRPGKPGFVRAVATTAVAAKKAAATTCSQF